MENRPRSLWFSVLTFCAVILFAAGVSAVQAQSTDPAPPNSKQDKEKDRKQNQQDKKKQAQKADAAKDQAAEQEKKQEPPATSPMDRLREKITGLSASAIEIISSGSMETAGDWTTIQENAEIRIGADRTLLADKILFNLNENKVRAEGNVVLLENKLRIGGDSLEMNLGDNTAVLENPFIENDEGFFISGTRLQKNGPDEYTLEGAKLTTCNQPTPQWQMAASSISFKAGEAATMRNLRLTLFDTIPVFYAPWMRIPLDRKRGTGFSIPEWGSSDYHGFWWNERFFWAIDDSQDTTIGLDYYEKRGYRYSAEYRNNLGDGNATNMYLYYIDDKSFPRTRYDSRIVNRTKLPFGFESYTDLQFLSDNTYRRDFMNRDIYYSPIFRKTMSLTNNFDGYSFLLAYSDTDRFITRNKINQIRYLPKIDFRTRERQLFDTPVFYSFSMDYVRPSIREVTRRIEQDKEDLVKGDTYDRFDLIGVIKMPIKLFAPWLSVTPYLLGRNTDYTSRYNPARTNIVEKSVTRQYYDAGFEMTGPIFSRIYGQPGEGTTIYKHVIQPELSYVYRSNIDDKALKQIIIVDQEDTFFRVHELRWGISNVLYSKSFTKKGDPGRVTELFRFGVSQYVSMEDGLLTSYDKRYVSNPSTVTASSRYSPLLFNASARVSDYLNAQGSMEYSTQESEVINYSVNGNLHFRSLEANVGWYRTIGVVRFDLGGLTRSNTNRIVSSGSIGLWDGMINLRGAYDYDFERERILNYLGGLDIRGQCLGFSVELVKLNIYNQNDLQTRFSITIGGLSKILGGGQD